MIWYLNFICNFVENTKNYEQQKNFIYAFGIVSPCYAI